MKKKENILIKKILNSLIRQLKNDLKKHPFFLINEHDLQAYLYTKLANEKQCSRYVDDGDEYENYLIHCEYAKGKYKKGEGTPGRRTWDIAVLNENLIPRDKNIYFDLGKKPVWIGMELKLNIDATKKELRETIYKDEDVSIESKGRGKFADWAVLFHINIAKKEYNKQDFKDIEDHFHKLKKKNKRAFYVYLETYREHIESNDVLV
jgi:hypothetical protein